VVVIAARKDKAQPDRTAPRWFGQSTDLRGMLGRPNSNTLAHANDADDGQERGSDKRLDQRAAAQPLSAIGRCLITPRCLLSSIERCSQASATANQRAFTSGKVDCFAIARQAA
jgi:hypothetical protein